MFRGEVFTLLGLSWFLYGLTVLGFAIFVYVLVFEVDPHRWLGGLLRFRVFGSLL